MQLAACPRSRAELSAGSRIAARMAIPEKGKGEACQTEIREITNKGTVLYGLCLLL